MKLEDYSTYIIDFERINQLTVHPMDAQQNKESYIPVSIYSITKSFMKRCILRFEDQFSKRYVINEKDNKLFNILHHNKIILSPQDIRNSRIEEVENI